MFQIYTFTGKYTLVHTNNHPREVKAFIEYLRCGTVSEQLLHLIAQEQKLDQITPSIAPSGSHYPSG